MLLDGTLQDAVEALAKRAADLRTRPVTVAEREKVAAADFLAGLGDWVKSNPLQAGSLLGGVAGAGLGGASTAFGNRGKPEEQKRSVLSSMLTGGLAGTALGGGGALAYKGYQGMQTGQQGFQPGDDLRPGEFARDGQKFKIDPKVLRQNPGLHSEVRKLTAQANPLDTGLKSVLGAGKALLDRQIAPDQGFGNPDGNFLDKYLPATSTWLPRLGLADAALHSQKLRLGERMGMGFVRPERSTDINHLLEGIKGKDSGIPEAIQKAMHQQNQPGGPGGTLMGMPASPTPGDVHVPFSGPNDKRTVANILTEGNRGAGSWKDWFKDRLKKPGWAKGQGHESVLDVKHQPMKDVVEETKGPTGSYKQTLKQPDGPPVVESLSRQQLEQAKLRGFRELNKDSPRSGLYKGILGQRNLGSPMARIGGRIAGYGLAPLAEYAVRSHLEDMNKQDRLRQLMAAHAQRTE